LDDTGGQLVVTNESIAPKFALFREYGPRTKHHCGDGLLGPMEQGRIRLADLLPPPAPPPPHSAATGARRGGKR
jgi:hypothetical protein